VVQNLKVKLFLCLPNNTLISADMSLARPTSRCILFDGENISFDASSIQCGAYVNFNYVKYNTGTYNFT
jgi:hypothetical protein